MVKYSVIKHSYMKSSNGCPLRPPRRRQLLDNGKTNSQPLPKLKEMFGMRPKQMRFVEEIKRVGCQAILDVVLWALPIVARLEVNLAQPAHSAGDMEELDYHGSLEIL